MESQKCKSNLLNASQSLKVNRNNELDKIKFLYNRMLFVRCLTFSQAPTFYKHINLTVKLNQQLL